MGSLVQTDSPPRPEERRGLPSPASPHFTIWLEAQLQAKLQVARIQCGDSFAEQRIRDLVVRSGLRSRQQEISTVEDVEALSLKLQVNPFGQLESLAQGHICVPLSRADEGVAAQVSGATQARTGEVVGKSRQCRCPSILPSGAAAAIEAWDN